MSTPTPPGDRIAKILARAGIASRREAERMIAEGRIQVNGVVIDSPALNVGRGDAVLIDGKPLPVPEPARLWLYHKPAGLVTTERDELGRATIFDGLPEDMPRVMSIGRLDLSSEGLLLLTNDGALKRRLELPSTGWLRRYRVRINGRPTDADFEPLRQGLTIGDESFLPMIVTLDRQQGANAWLTVGLREGKNREIRRAMEDLGFAVNRLIRLSYGPFQLGQLKPGEVEEVRRKVLRDQLGEATVVVVKSSQKQGFGPRRADLGPRPQVAEEPRVRQDGDDRPRRKGPPRDGGPARSGEEGPRKFTSRGAAKPARSDNEGRSRAPRNDDAAKPFRKGPPRDGARPARSGEDGPRKFTPKSGPKPSRSGDETRSRGRRDEDGAKPFRKGPPRDDSRPARSDADGPRKFTPKSGAKPVRSADGAARKFTPKSGAKPDRSGAEGGSRPPRGSAKPGGKPGGGKPSGGSGSRGTGGKPRPGSRPRRSTP
ncbi:pseudouridine synthase [Seohaeicola nanhaiensis]|uniref:Pseudouridine synthase n=1 Tax=Seohaeicola nanhaiensis TaxID=1387282 RepID=A0ABV9KHI5_9RHOB